MVAGGGVDFLGLAVRRALGFTDDDDQDQWVEACNAFCLGG